MFENRGPLADFHSKILIVQAFGLLPEMFDRDLHRVKRIRNVFAHAARPITFDLKEISDEVFHSEFLIFVRTTDMPWTELAINGLENPRAGFILIVRYLFLLIDRAVQGKGGAPLQTL